EARRDQLAANLQAAQAGRDKAYNGTRLEEKAVARAQVKAAQARLDKLEAGSRPEEIEQARQDLAGAEARLENAHRDLDREKVIGSASTKAAYDQTLATYEHCQAAVKAARARLKLLEAGPRVEEISEARAELERTAANLALLEAGTRSEELLEADARVAELRARLREIEAQLREMVVVA